MRILYDNIVDGATLTASTEVTGYDVEQVQDQRLSTVWQSSSASQQSIVVTLPTLPEYPDDPAGTTSLSKDFVDAQGWTAVNCTLSYSGGKMIVTATAANPRLSRACVAEKTMRVKLRKLTGAATNSRITNTAGNVYGNSKNYSTDGFHEWYVGAGASGDQYFYPGYDGSANGDTYEITFIYIGTGAYLPNSLLDLSGNANHGTIFGATPVETPYGRGLGFNPVSIQRVSLDINKNNFTGAFTVSAIVEGKVRTTLQNIYSRRSAAAGNRGIDTGLSASNLPYMTVSADGTATVTLTADAGAECTSNSDLKFIFIPSTLMAIYKNGAVIKSLTSGVPATVFWSASQPCNISTAAGEATGVFDGWIAQLRLYARGVADWEALNLSNQTPWVRESDGLAGDWDIDKAYKVNTAAVMGHNLLTGTTLKIQGNNSDNWDAPDVDETITVNPDMSLKFLSNTYIKKYWRFTFGTQGSLEIGRLWLGQYMTINPSSLLNFKIIKKRSDTVIHGKNRQKWSTPGVGWRRFELTFPPTEENMIYLLSQMYDGVGNHSSLIFCNFDTIREYVLVEPCYVSIDGDIGFTHTRRMKMEWALNLEEEK